MSNESLARLQYESIVALNYSGMKEILRSPAHYQTMLNKERSESKALRIGKMVHESILQPEIFELYKPEPQVDRRTKEGKETIEFFKASLKDGDRICSADEYDFVLSVADSVTIALEKKGIKFKETESVQQATCGVTGVNLKCCLDSIGEDNVIYDIKTTDDGSPQAFYRTALNYKYYIQSYLYKAISNLNKFVFVVVEKEPPFAVSFYELGPEFDEKAKQEVDKALLIYSECMKTNKWPGYTEDIVKLDLPKKQISPNLI